MTTINPRSLGVEADHLPSTLEELAELRDRLIAAGVAAHEASGIAGWLTDKATGRPDRTSQPTRAKYRKTLAALELEPTPGPARRRRGRGDGGWVHARLALVGTAAASGAQLAATGHPALAACVVPIILDTSVTSSCGAELEDAA